MTPDALIARLDRVKEAGPDRWIACCPAHDDRSPSLSIRYVDDGRVLLHCFAGCDVESVLDALGLTLSDLMPDRPLDHRTRPVRRRMPARDALASLDHEALVVALIAKDAHQQQYVDKDMLDRLEKAVAQIGNVRDVVAPARHKP